MSGWIKLHRSLLDWEWYDDINARILLIHLLISVNYEDKKWKGTLVKKGSMILSWSTLSLGCGLTIKQCRTAMKKLEDSGEVARQVASKWQVISLVKWEKLQQNDLDEGSVLGKQKAVEGQAKGRQRATTKEYNNIKNIRSKEEDRGEPQKKDFNKKDFRKSLLELGADETHVEDWFKARDKKKSVYSETALNQFLNECEKNNFPVSEAVKISAANSWAGFKYDWYKNLQNNNKLNSNGKPARTFGTNR